MTRRFPLLVVLAYGAGLVVGLSRFLDPPLVLGAIVLVAFLGRRHGLLLTGLSLVALGVASGVGAGVGAGHACAARLTSGRHTLVVQPLEPVRQGHRRVRVRLHGAACVGPVWARWASRAATSDGRVRATVSWRPREGLLGLASGTLLVEEVRETMGSPSLVVRVRAALMESVEQLYGPRAPLVNALILNRKDALDPELRDTFAQSGMIHLLAISGFHVGVVMLWSVMLARALRLGRVGSSVGSVVIVVGYVALLGWPPAATRAAILATLFAVSRARQRYVPVGALVATTCLIMLIVDPWVVAQPGAWMSIAAFGGVIVFDEWSHRVLRGGRFVRTVAASIGATVVTAPITAALFGVVSLTGVVLNLVAMPLAALALPAVLASVLVFPIVPALGSALATSSGALLGLLTSLADWGAKVPGGSVTQVPGLMASLPWLAVLAACWWLMGHSRTIQETGRRALWLGAAVSWAWLLWPHPTSAEGSDLTLHFLDVGQGDGIAIRTPGGRWVIVDGGPRSGRWDAGRQVVVPFLRRQGVRGLSAVVMTHPDADHLGGIPSILDAFPTLLVIEPAATPASLLYLAFLEGLVAGGPPWRPGRTGDRFEVDGVSFTVVHPDRDWSGWGELVNEDSVVLLVEFGGFRALLTGDVGFPAESSMAGRIGRVDVLKVGHHGSKGSTGAGWLSELRPAVAIVSVGDNRYGHPAPQALARLEREGASVWRTDRVGSITVRTDGIRYVVAGRGRTQGGLIAANAAVRDTF